MRRLLALPLAFGGAWFNTVITLTVIYIWVMAIGGIIRGLTYVFALSQTSQNILFWVAVGVTLAGIVAFFRRVHLRGRAEIAALQTASSNELEAILKSRPELRYAIAREIARRMVLERLPKISNEDLKAFVHR